MNHAGIPPNSMSGYSPKEYWAGIADDFRSADPSGIAPVLHPGAPAWFNQLIDKQQFHAIRRALALARIPPAARSLDVGCGTGRWVRRYEQLGFRAAGLDVTLGMLNTARQCGTDGLLVAGEAHRLPFSNGAFDFVSDVTVVQHIPTELQSAVIGEMMRVLKPKGHLLLFELIRGRGAHIFPRSPEDWIEQASSNGATLLGWVRARISSARPPFCPAGPIRIKWKRYPSRHSTSGELRVSRSIGNPNWLLAIQARHGIGFRLD
jgi:SAM-dependent methyltransferase